jgi:hypothetical protein
MRMKLTFFLPTLVLALIMGVATPPRTAAAPSFTAAPTMPTLPAAATDRSVADRITPVCSPSWGTITIPICL